MVAAQAVHAHQHAQHRHQHGDDKGVLLPPVAQAPVPGVVYEMDHHGFQQRDGGGDGGENHQQVEQQPEDGADGAHAVKHVLHGDEQQPRAAQRAVGVQSEPGGNDAQARQDGDEGIHHHDDQGVFLQVFLFIQIGAVGDHNGHADGQGEEHLPAGGGDNGKDAGGLLDNAVGHRPAGDEHILQAVHRPGQGDGPDDGDHQQDEQHRHAHGADPLNAVADAAHDDEHGDGHEDHTVEGALPHVAHEGVEHLAAAHAVGAEAAVEHVAQVQHQIFQAVAPQRAVEAEDEEGGGHPQPAYPFQLLGHQAVGLHGASPGLAAQGQLGEEHHEAAHRRQHQVGRQEGKAAVGAHLIGEAPDVAQAHGGAHSRHQEAEIGAEALSLIHFYLSFTRSGPCPQETILSFSVFCPAAAI